MVENVCCIGSRPFMSRSTMATKWKNKEVMKLKLLVEPWVWTAHNTCGLFAGIILRMFSCCALRPSKCWNHELWFILRVVVADSLDSCVCGYPEASAEWFGLAERYNAVAHTTPADRPKEPCRLCEGVSSAGFNVRRRERPLDME